jgi:hypothetical protein
VVLAHFAQELVLVAALAQASALRLQAWAPIWIYACCVLVTIDAKGLKYRKYNNTQ